VQQHYDAVTGDHGVTISTGKDSASQRDEVKDLLQNVMGELQAIAAIAPPGAAAKLLALNIRLAALGPLGDEMADTLDPPDAQQKQGMALQQAQQQAQMAQQALQEMNGELQKLKLEKAGKIIDNEYQKQVVQLQNDVKVLIAEIQAKAQDSAERIQMYKEFWLENHGAAHERAMQAEQHGHEKDSAAMAAVNAQQQQEQQGGDNGNANSGGQ